MDIGRIDADKLEEYAKEAKKRWGNTEAYKQSERIFMSKDSEAVQKTVLNFMNIFKEIGEIKTGSPESGEAQSLVKKLQDFISENFYTCTKEILAGLGNMYSEEGDMKDNIDKAGGVGTADFTADAIAFFCKK